MVLDAARVEEVEKLVESLSNAIKAGNVEEAKLKASELAKRKTVIDMILEPKNESRDKVITVNIHIEDMLTTTSRPIKWNVKVSTKIHQLKRLVSKAMVP